MQQNSAVVSNGEDSERSDDTSTGRAHRIEAGHKDKRMHTGAVATRNPEDSLKLEAKTRFDSHEFAYPSQRHGRRRIFKSAVIARPDRQCYPFR
jgi:hypothetical protein